MNEKFKCRIVELREARKWTQGELAKRLQVDLKTVYHWENGNTFPSEQNITRLSTLFSVSTDYLLGMKTNNAINLDRLPEHEMIRFVAMFQTYLSYTEIPG